MQFSEVVGHESLKKHLRQGVQEGRISHAQLFLGNEGSGNLALALAYARYICCESRTSEDSCGVCPSCLKYKKYIHPDLHFVFPVVKLEGSKPTFSEHYIVQWREALIGNPYMNLNGWIQSIASENKQGGIFEAESGEIIRKISMKSYESEYKIMIVWMPEKMNPTCANKLLKILEEPPEKTLFILVTENTGMLLTTILSRCQLIKIPRIHEDDLRKALMEKNVEEPRLSDIVRLANGNFLKAQELIHENETNLYFETFTGWMRNCYAQKLPELVKWVDEMAAMGREKQKNFLLFALRMMRENFMLSNGTQTLAFLTENEANFSSKFHPFINEKNIYEMSELLSQCHYHIESNANPKILFLDLSIKMMGLLRK